MSSTLFSLEDLQFDTKRAYTRFMTFQEHLEQLGDAVAAKRYGITERAARSYRTGMRKPRPAVAFKIAKKSLGELTLAIIYGEKQ